MTEQRPEEPSLRIGDLARLGGVTSRTIRHYHSIGLLPEPGRDPSGHRRYGQGQLDRLLAIGRLRAEGVAADEIAGALAAADD